MTRSWRLPTVLLISVGLLLALNSPALSYKHVFEQQIIPDGADDLDSPSAAGGSSPQAPSRIPGTDVAADSSPNLTVGARWTISTEELLAALRTCQIIFKMGVCAL